MATKTKCETVEFCASCARQSNVVCDQCKGCAECCPNGLHCSPQNPPAEQCDAAERAGDRRNGLSPAADSSAGSKIEHLAGFDEALSKLQRDLDQQSAIWDEIREQYESAQSRLNDRLRIVQGTARKDKSEALAYIDQLEQIIAEDQRELQKQHRRVAELEHVVDECRNEIAQLRKQAATLTSQRDAQSNLAEHQRRQWQIERRALQERLAVTETAAEPHQRAADERISDPKEDQPESDLDQWLRQLEKLAFEQRTGEWNEKREQLYAEELQEELGRYDEVELHRRRCEQEVTQLDESLPTNVSQFGSETQPVASEPRALRDAACDDSEASQRTDGEHGGRRQPLKVAGDDLETRSPRASGFCGPDDGGEPSNDAEGEVPAHEPDLEQPAAEARESESPLSQPQPLAGEECGDANLPHAQSPSVQASEDKAQRKAPVTPGGTSKIPRESEHSSTQILTQFKRKKQGLLPPLLKRASLLLLWSIAVGAVTGLIYLILHFGYGYG